ncbi:hypothetical protein GCM10007916_31900 [Psychromonas marina]|uniref:Uncharacterized protein n=1 Tax=Psychromonas marina TaxID=88364 RepID=A0ABQ6E4I2_9GAMM|nr:hypothetical protein [Psychromonas marina]GLS92120.1 hypothetical protein GCM10007916_31900 [Psychromonas marina]
MTMVSAKEFSGWLIERFADENNGVTLNRKDINHLTGRQSFTLSFIHDIHYELMQHGIAFVTDTSRGTFFLIPIRSAKPWRERLELQYEKELFCNIYPIEKRG